MKSFLGDRGDTGDHGYDGRFGLKFRFVSLKFNLKYFNILETETKVTKVNEEKRETAFSKLK